jgi:hypothetical protein
MRPADASAARIRRRGEADTLLSISALRGLQVCFHYGNGQGVLLLCEDGTGGDAMDAHEQEQCPEALLRPDFRTLALPFFF